MKLSKVISASIASVMAATTLAVITSADNTEYNGYLSFQTSAYSFRNKVDDASYGKDSGFYDNVIVWGTGDYPEETFPDYEDNWDYDVAGYVIPVNYGDTKITGNGTYTVSIDDFDWALDKSAGFNLLLVSTDIPVETGANITSVSVIVDGEVAATIDTSAEEPEAGYPYVTATAANAWNSAIESYSGVYPTSTLALEFTIDGLDSADSAAAEEEPTEEAAPVTTDTTTETNAATGVADGIALVTIIGAAATVSAIAARRRKK